MQKYIKLFFKSAAVSCLGVFLFSHIVFAAEISGQCSQNGYTISTVNGVFTDEEGARNNQRALFIEVGNSYKGEDIDYHYLLNPSHLGGLGDILKSAYQGIFDKETVNDYDLTEMIKAASEKVRTQKLLLVAHSQGNFYANSFYDSVAGKLGGVPAESIGVYSVATPASRVAGGGKWLTSDTDKVIAGAVDRVPFKSIMAPNTHIELSDEDDALGHNFTDVYLKYRAGQIVSDIESSLDNLKTNNSQSDNESCIAPPKITIVHKIERAAFAVADPVANVGVSAVSNTISGTYYAGKTIASAVQKAAQKTTAVIGNAIQDVKNIFSDKRVSQMAVADIGIAADNQNIPPIALSVIPAEAGIQTQEIDSSPVAQNDKEETEIASLLVGQEARNDENKEDVPPRDNIEVSAPRNDAPIHAPYQWTEVVHAPYGGEPAVENKTEQPQSSSQNIQSINDGKPDFVGAGVSDVVIVENNSDANSSPEAQKDIINEEAAPEAPQPEIPQQPATPDIQFYLTDHNVRNKNLTLNWKDKNSVVQNWELEYRMGPNFGWEILKQVQDDTGGAVQDDTEEGAHSYQFIAQYDDLTYYFRLRGQDASGNPTEWKTLQADISTKPVVINEIAWRGTAASPYDEWIELVNKTDQEIDLSGWVLKTNDANINVALAGKIAPNGFYLLERTDDTTISNIVADQIYTGALRDAQGQYDRGDAIYLIDENGNTIDQTQVALSGQGHLERRSSERISVWSNSLYLNNWAAYQGGGESGVLDANGNIIYGTPKNSNSQANKYLALNSGVFEAPPQITQEAIFLKNRGPYMVNGSVEFMGIKIQIEPGAEFELNSFGQLRFHNSAKLIAKGTENDKIVVKGLSDDYSVLYFSGAKAEIENLEFKGGKIVADNSNIKINKSVIKDGKYGLSVLQNNSEFQIENSEFSGDNGYNFAGNPYYGQAILIKQSQGSIKNNAIKNNQRHGIYIDSLSGILDISGNSFSGNSSSIATNRFINFDLSNNVFDNGAYELLVYNPIVDNGEVATISNKISYILYDRAKDSDWYKVGDPEIKAGGTLKIEPGAVVKFNNNSLLKTNGRLEAVGTTENPIVLKYMWDYASYGDIKDNVSGEIDSSKYIQFGEGSEYAIENTITRESGDSGYQSYWLVKQ